MPARAWEPSLSLSLSLSLSPQCFLHYITPFSWRHAVVPILPRQLVELLDAPVTTMIGLPTTFTDEKEFKNVSRSPYNACKSLTWPSTARGLRLHSFLYHQESTYELPGTYMYESVHGLLLLNLHTDFLMQYTCTCTRTHTYTVYVHVHVRLCTCTWNSLLTHILLACICFNK